MKFEQELGEIVNKVNAEIKNFEKQKNGQGNVVLLVGKTGAGKSTLFNFLIGANFKAKQDTEDFELDLEYDSDKFSLMKSGCDSVTKFPKCFYQEQYHHLVVDFPGFSDTKGYVDEIIIQSLFNKIIQKSNLKIVLVNYQPEDEFANRGADLQEFLKEVIKDNSVNLEKITLLMNQYIGDTDEVDLIQDWQDTFQSQLNSNVGKIIIQKAVIEEDNLHYFNTEQRNSIWKQLVETPVINLQPHPFKNRDIITSYLTESINLVLLKTVQELDNNLSTQQLTLDQICQLTKKYTLMEELVKKDKSINQVIVWIDSYLKLVQEIKSILKFEGKLKFNQTLFVQIYTFFLDFANQIDGYGQVKSTIDKIEKNCRTTLSNLKKKQEEIVKLQEAEKQKQEEEKKKQEAEKQRLIAQKQKEEAEKKRLEEEKAKQEAEKKELLAKQKAEQEKKEAEERKKREYEQQQEYYRKMREAEEARQIQCERQQRILEAQREREYEAQKRREEEIARKQREEMEEQKRQNEMILKQKREAEQKAREIKKKQEEEQKRLEKEKQDQIEAQNAKDEADKKQKEQDERKEKERKENERKENERKENERKEKLRREEEKRIEEEKSKQFTLGALFTTAGYALVAGAFAVGTVAAAPIVAGASGVAAVGYGINKMCSSQDPEVPDKKGLTVGMISGATVGKASHYAIGAACVGTVAAAPIVAGASGVVAGGYGVNKMFS